MRNLLLLASLFVLLTAKAENSKNEADSTRNVVLSEIWITNDTISEKIKLDESPTSELDIKFIEKNRIEDIKNLSMNVPNFFMPDYGSRLTSAIYIRGIGSRINTPAVGMFVDDVPYIDKSAFDFNFYDIESIEILRGPQSIYSRNAMGGLIKINTRSPFNYQGTNLKLSAGNYNNYSASATHYHKINDKFAFSAGGFYKYNGGYFENTYLKKQSDWMHNGGGKIRAIVKPNEIIDIDLSLSYERNNQGGYAYAPYDKTTGKIGNIATNREGSYKRDLVNSYMRIDIKPENLKGTISSITGYQYLKDNMFMDQDFTPRDVYTIEQKQKIHTISQEFKYQGHFDILGQKNQFQTSVSGFYQSLNTDAPVTFHEDGVSMIQNMMDEAMASSPVKVVLTNPTMPIAGNYSTPRAGASISHIHKIYLCKEKLRISLGLRLDYEKMWIEHNTSSSMTAQAYMMGKPMGQPITMPVNIEGKEDDNYLKFIPKINIAYTLPTSSNNIIYGTVSRGYRSGGYNIQMFSDIVKDKLMNKPDMGGGRPSGKNGENSSYANIKDIIQYKPEQTWNYEIGTQINPWPNKLKAGIAVFYMQTTDQQISMFAPEGLGRMTVNSGKSRSIGTELSIDFNPIEGLIFNASYGYTNAKFTEYKTNEVIGNITKDIDYSGNYIPMAPQHTLYVGGNYRYKCDQQISLFDYVNFGLSYNGAGKIYFTEKNDVSQDFYGTLNANIGIEKKRFHLNIWFSNILDKDYKTFYFETIGETMKDKAGFFQQGKPFTFGINMKYSF